MAVRCRVLWASTDFDDCLRYRLALPIIPRAHFFVSFVWLRNLAVKSHRFLPSRVDIYQNLWVSFSITLIKLDIQMNCSKGQFPESCTKKSFSFQLDSSQSMAEMNSDSSSGENSGNSNSSDKSKPSKKSRSSWTQKWSAQDGMSARMFCGRAKSMIFPPSITCKTLLISHRDTHRFSLDHFVVVLIVIRRCYWCKEPML